ncbi:MAG TPA: cupredoxin domain-containing protein [Gaiellaceae bacterium]|jgi:plastocyanin
MRKLIPAAAIAFVLAAVGATSAPAQTTAVSITKSGFRPASITLAAGDTITWTNNDNTNHQVVADNGGFSSAVLAPGSSYSHTFDSAGSSAFHDGLHPGLKGSVAVNAKGAISIMRTGFAPASANVTAGDNIRWTNHDTTNHQVVADDGSFSSPVLAPGQSFDHSFASAATVNYHDGLKPAAKGSVVVAAAPVQTTVTLRASRHAVTHGAAVVLSGTVSSLQAGEDVSVVVEPNGLAARTIGLTTTTGGRFSIDVAPRIATAYHAELKTTGSNPQSPVTVVYVRPRIALHRTTGRAFSAVVVAARPLSGRTITLTRLIPSLHRWVTVRRVVLHTRSSTTAAATFHVRVRHGLRLRASVTRPGPGYLAGTSNFVRS